MTACVDNNQKKGGAAKAVSATLAGVLAVGMVPAMAFADEAPETEEPAAGLLATDQTVIDKATVNEVGFTNGTVINPTDGIEVQKDKAAALGDIQLRSITLPDELTPLVDGQNAEFELIGYKWGNADGTYTAYDGSNYTAGQDLGDVAADPNCGAPQLTYAAFEIVDSPRDAYNGNIFYLPFTFVNKSLEGAFLIENGNIADTTFQYTGNVITPGVAINDTVLVENTDYTMELAKVGDNANETVDATDGFFAGETYVAKITGEGAYEGSDIKLNFTIGQLDLSQTNVVLENVDFSGNNAADLPSANVADYIGTNADGSTRIFNNGAKINPDLFNLTYVSGPDGAQSVTDKLGAYTYELTLKSQTELGITDDVRYAALVASITGEKSVTIDKVDTQLGKGSFFYGSPSAGQKVFGDVVIDTDYNDVTVDYFNKDSIKVYADAEKTIELPFALKVYDANFNEATEADLLTNGTWYVYAVVDSANAAVDYKYGGISGALEVVVTNAAIPAANVTFAYDGVNMNTTDTAVNEATYDGSDLMSHISITVKNKQGAVLAQGTDYNVVIWNGEGKIVDSIVDADTYRIQLTSDTYSFDDDDVVLKVNPARIASVDVSNMEWLGDNEFFDYTGEAITPEFVYATTERPTTADYKALPDVYEVEYWYTDSTNVFDNNGDVIGTALTFEKVADMTAEGTYVLVIHPDEDAEGVDNFLFDSYATTNPFLDENGDPIAEAIEGVQLPWTTAVVSDANVFADVPTEHWAASYIYDAKTLEYINGYAGTNLFRPDSPITRADAVIVLYNMAGGTVYADELQNSVFDFMGWTADFADVDTNAYYMAALSWAQKVGLVTGYEDGSGNFGPTDQITREQFATMLYRYAGMSDHDTAIADQAAELAKYPDQALIDGYAQAAVAWLSQEGIMTGDKGSVYNGYMLPDNNVTRAEVAKMAVSLQPTQIDLFE